MNCSLCLSDDRFVTNWRHSNILAGNRVPDVSEKNPEEEQQQMFNTRLLYKTCVYLLLGKIENTFEDWQPEKQHGFRSNQQMEEHLLSTNVMI